jgi:hypothetical protein
MILTAQKTPITIPERIFAKALVEHGDPLAAAKAVKDNGEGAVTSSLPHLAMQFLNRQRVRDYILQALVEHGLDSNLIARTHVRLLQAKKHQFNKNVGAFEEFDDNQAQLKALEMTYELVGAKAPTQTENLHEHHITDEVRQRFESRRGMVVEEAHVVDSKEK